MSPARQLAQAPQPTAALIAGLQLLDAAADLDHLAHRFMADAETEIGAEALAVIDVQIAAADAAALHLHDGIALVGDRCVVEAAIADVARALIEERFHIGLVDCGITKEQRASAP
jgi:hypothetical protein